MTGFIFYMILGASISIYRLFVSKVHPNDPWAAQRQKHLEAFDSYPIVAKIAYILLMSALGLPILLADTLMFLKSRLFMMKYNTREIKEDIFKYLYLGTLHGEAVSYSVYNRFNEEEAESIEKAFKEAEARIIKHGFIPLTVGNFVEFHQDGKDLPALRIKGKVYADKAA